MFAVTAVPPPLTALGPVWATVNDVVDGTARMSNVPLKLVLATPLIVILLPGCRNPCGNVPVVVKVTTFKLRTAPLAAMVRVSVPLVR
jgi:hypothetical protein